jgi:hypothetical protein
MVRLVLSPFGELFLEQRNKINIIKGENKMIELGQKVRDKVTGFEGIVVCVSEWLNGCHRVGVKPPLDKDGNDRDEYWVDAKQLEIIDKENILKKKEKKEKIGGPTSSNPTQW